MMKPRRLQKFEGHRLLSCSLPIIRRSFIATPSKTAQFISRWSRDF
jgi:hypothetical protein